MNTCYELIEYLKNLGIEVNTSTKARGHQGFYVKNRIDISKNLSEDKILPTLVHEFTHYIHYKLEPEMMITGGTLEKIFDDNVIDFYYDELISVTNFVDNNSKCEKLLSLREAVKMSILDCEKIIKSKYPNFKRSKKFKEFDSAVKGSNVKYLLKYDRVKVLSPNIFSNHSAILSIDNIEKDFPTLSTEFCAYVRLKSLQRKQSRVSARINKLNKYYLKPTELFARFTQGLCLNCEKIKSLAPNCYKRFFELLDSGYYLELKSIENILSDTHHS